MTNSFVLMGQTLSFVGDPFRVGPEQAVEHHARGAVWVENGLIKAVGPASEIRAMSNGVPVIDHGDALIMAGFVDCHVHYPQISIIASYGEQLLDWLVKYTFPTETTFDDVEHARNVASLFFDECRRNGITTSGVYATVHPESVEGFFSVATERNLRMVCGKVLMDRNAPEGLLDTVESGYAQSKALIEKWHGKGRNVYAITPRFAPTSSSEQLEAAGALWKEFPDVAMQTHLSENKDEISWVADLFPGAPDYFGVYEKFGLTGPGAIFGHAIHLTERERAAFCETGSAIAHCPTSNTFIGSGLFDMKGLRDGENPVTVGLATDIAGGSSLSMFATMRCAYEIAQLRGHSLHPAKAYYLATVGSARALRLDDRIGNLVPGNEADIVVIDLASTPIIANRCARAGNIWDALFVQMIMADDRAITATYSAGRRLLKSEKPE